MTLREAVSSIVAVVASFTIVWIVCVHVGIDASPAILSAALAVTLSRDAQRPSWRGYARQLIVLPIIALAAGAVGVTFQRSLALGGALFTLCVALSIWLRRYGTLGRALGRLVALPFVAMLAVPVRPAGTPLVAGLSVIGAGIVAVMCTSLARAIAPAHEPGATPPRPQRERKPGTIDPPTRMALQMLVALALAFIAGGLLQPEHWFWVVLTAFIVCSGAIARGDAIYKAILRLGGAIGGTLAGVLLAPLDAVQGPLRAGIIFAVLFFAMWMRERNYAYWAAGATLIFALLQGTGGAPPVWLFAERVLAIALGALCAVVATWFVFPLRTEQIVKRRIADLIAAHKRGDAPAVAFHLRELDRAAAPVMLHRRVFRRFGDDQHPAAMAERAREFVLAPPKPASSMEREVTVQISVAMTIDGYIDDRRQQRLILSNSEDFESVRTLRAQYDAVLVGAGTVRADNPSLRAIAENSRPIRVTVTRSGNLDPQARLFDGNARTIVLAAPEVVDALRERLGERADVHALDPIRPDTIVEALAGFGVRSLFVEGGTEILTAFLASGRFDRLRLAIAPFFAGHRGGARVVHAAVFADGADHRLILKQVRTIGDMAVLDYERKQ